MRSIPVAIRLTAVIFFVVTASVAIAEIRTITATGEYRMGDNDTRTLAKQQALQDAKRLALERAGTYLESVTEVKQFQLSRDEVRLFTAGIVEVTEQITRSEMEGETTIVRVEVTCQIDTAVMARQIDSLRGNERVTGELRRAHDEATRLQQENGTLRQQLASAKSKPEIEALQQKRQEVLTDLDVNNLLAQAWVALNGAKKGSLVRGSSSAAGRTRARGLLEQALMLAPSDARVHSHMGSLLAEEGDLAGAVAAYQKALRLSPDNVIDRVVDHTNLGAVLADQGDLEGAIAEYRRALRLKADDPITHYNFGKALGAKGDFDGAIAEFRTALRLSPNESDFHTDLATALSRKGDLSGAIAQYRKALRLNPDNAAAHTNFATTLYQKGDLSGAIGEYRAALRLNPDDADAHHNLGAVLSDKWDFSGAIVEFRAALRLNPNYAGTYFNLGKALLAKGQRAKAAREFREYLRLAPQTPAEQEYIQEARATLRKLE